MTRRSVLFLVLPFAAACAPKTVSDTLDDAAITARVKTVLLNDPQIAATKIDVTTTNGVVTMSGTVRSQSEEARAVELAHQVSGVREVRSTLRVEQ